MTNKYSFENFIMQCCKADEPQLRKWLKKVLSRAGFHLIEDDYVSPRSDNQGIKNLLAVRGDPKVCLVSHTDTCREHCINKRQVNPTIKIIDSHYGEERFIIQDKYCQVQLGGDDRLGVAINTWIALNTGYDMGLLFTTDEEIGMISAEHIEMPQLMDFDVLVQVDRGNSRNQLVHSICGVQLCSDGIKQKLLEVSYKIGLPRNPVEGFLTDVYSIKKNRMCKNAVNMTCGYHNSYGSQPDEYIDIQEARETLTYVAEIVKEFYLNEDNHEASNFPTFEEDLFSEEQYMIEKYEERPAW